jgi:hypothetical protein
MIADHTRGAFVTQVTGAENDSQVSVPMRSSVRIGGSRV